jgi:hypothetical protein
VGIYKDAIPAPLVADDPVFAASVQDVVEFMASCEVLSPIRNRLSQMRLRSPRHPHPLPRMRRDSSEKRGNFNLTQNPHLGQ